jgi:hypothetical protein
MSNPKQKILFSAEYLLDVNPLKKYEILFDNLDCSPLETNLHKEGRPPVPKSALLKALIYKNLKPLPTLFDVGVELIDNPSAALKCGLDPSSNPNALKERLSSFLKHTSNSLLQSVKNSLVFELINRKQITGKIVSIDSCNILANVKENNLKTSCKDRFDKFKIPKGDRGARLGVMVNFNGSSNKKLRYFWGYRNIVVSDALSELPVTELTKPANASEQSLFIPSFTLTQDTFHFPVKEVVGDAIFDAEYILKFIMNDLKAIPRIARNLRWNIYSDVKASSSGGLICIAGFDMLYWGKFKDRGKIRKKFVCPITHSKKFASKIPLCPWNHPKFVNGKGCTAYLRGDYDIRKKIDYGSKAFKKSYNKRTSSERIFSRLLTLCMQNPSVIGLNATANHCTIAHITVLLLALTAVKTGHKDKIRFIKKFLPHL